MSYLQDMEYAIAEIGQEELLSAYDKRQDAMIANHQACMEEFLYELLNNIGDINYDYTGKKGLPILYPMAYIRNYLNRSANNELNRLLKKHNYQPQAELFDIMLLIDLYNIGEIDYTTLKRYFLIFQTYKGIKAFPDYTYILNTKFGNSSIKTAYKCLNLPALQAEERHAMCHQLTGDALRLLPNIYGAYFLIPNEFKGVFEHSVIISKDKKLVIDLANNIALPLSFFQKYYHQYQFMISSDEFRYLDREMLENYGIHLNMADIYSAQRVRSKIK